MPLDSETASDPPCDLEAHCPQSDGNVLLLSGPPTIVLQFVRHYGHPKRDRFREIVQLLIIVIFASLFPLELVVMSIWMPVQLQNVWLCYQLHVVTAMLVARYTRLGTGSDTSSALARVLAIDGCMCLSDHKSEHSVLFGHTRNGPETMKVDLQVTYHGRYKAGKEALEELLDRQRLMNNSDTTLAAPEAKN